jgi:hypothetical protein
VKSWNGLMQRIEEKSTALTGAGRHDG